MKKSILNVGRALNKSEQKSINGGLGFYHSCDNVNDQHICEQREECIWIPDLVGNGGYCNLRRNEDIPHIDP
jgi:hypothetical protein